MLNEALATLADALALGEASLRALLTDRRVYDWQRDPFSRGAYSYVPVGALGAPVELAKPLANTLFFAGEATHQMLNGTVAGAIASGYRAAEQAS